jgi:hypothetical protein
MKVKGLCEELFGGVVGRGPVAGPFRAAPVSLGLVEAGRFGIRMALFA